MYTFIHASACETNTILCIRLYMRQHVKLYIIYIMRLLYTALKNTTLQEKNRQ